MAAKTTETKTILLPEGRLINHALFERDAYAAEGQTPGKAKYKVEIAFDPAAVTGEGTVEDSLANAIQAKWGKKVADEFLAGGDGFVDPRLDGDGLARGREEKGKKGDAYKGRTVLRASTAFNKHGADAAGGAAVFGPDTIEIDATRQHEVYPGCYGIAAVTIGTYEEDVTVGRGQKKKMYATFFYLSAFQKTRDGEKLIQAADRSTLFSPVAPAAAESGVRRRRAG